MADLKTFAVNMNRYGNNVAKNATRSKRAAAIACLQSVVLATPVGNPTLWQDPTAKPAGYVGGRARGNWFVGLGRARTGQSDTPDPSGGATIAAGTVEAGGTIPGQSIHITNNLPYIIPLNEGHSTQAPAGFVQNAVAAARAAVRRMRFLEA